MHKFSAASIYIVLVNSHLLHSLLCLELMHLMNEAAFKCLLQSINAQRTNLFLAFIPRQLGMRWYLIYWRSLPLIVPTVILLTIYQLKWAVESLVFYRRLHKSLKVDSHIDSIRYRRVVMLVKTSIGIWYIV